MKVKMCLVKYHVLIFFALLLKTCFALNCRSDSGPKEEELRNIYKSCLKKQDGKNSSFSRNYGDDPWNESQGYSRSQWDRDEEMSGRSDGMYGRDSRMSNRDDKMSNRDDRMGGRYNSNDRENNYGSRSDRNNDDRYNSDDRYSTDDRSNRNDRNGREDRNSDRYNSDDRNNGYDRNSRDDRYNDRNSDRNNERNNRNDRTNSRDDGMSFRGNNRDDNSNYRNDKMYGREERMAGRNNMGRNDMSMAGSRLGRSDWNGGDDFPMTDEFGSFSGQELAYNAYRSTTQIPRRFKREKRKEMNSGQRSQYNPNYSSKHKTNNDPYRNDDRNSNESNSSKEMDKKACALHCFLENLEMVDDNGMPDRYLVTHAITKDIKDEDLKDFLQESIEECFQILDNENSEDKCGFSKNLLICLSEKGRANCNDWKNDFQF